MTIQELERDFFEQLGRAIAKWQLVEMQLFRVYARLQQPPDVKIARETFYKNGRVLPLQERLKWTDRAATTSPLVKNLQEWNDLSARISNLAKDYRHQFAHFTVYFHMRSDGAKPDEFGPWLRRSYFVPEEAEKREHGVENIKAALELFEALETDLRNFADTLPAPKPSSVSGLV